MFHREDWPLTIDEKKLNRLAGECVGAPWKEFGRDPETGIDCFGLVLHILNGIGLTLPDMPITYVKGETSKSLCDRGFSRFVDMHSCVKAVPTSEAIAGDVLLFCVDTKERVNHMGVLLPKNHYIHTMRQTGCHVSPISGKFARLFLKLAYRHGDNIR